VKASQEGPQEQVVDVSNARGSSQLVAEMLGEIGEITTVGPECVGRDVALAVQVAEEGVDGPLQCLSEGIASRKGNGLPLLATRQLLAKTLQAPEGTMGQCQSPLGLVLDPFAELG